ncbi:LOW QUALITY PROTEIN: uncharacterized protein si:ch211-214j8.12 [Gadus macrocephalus]|uniref:LOW QUALITY PROTEIN: uncharacterized protein si:ch211-214j8.12 n=1 Tax=Gadus macrocephalus TaxID=80720 RepID=UPI0028CB412F|nr:LOW QUALITY PROTEIN: uncharacterized protein si:ch211-214j8.12 [Gadus macrocephalus]
MLEEEDFRASATSPSAQRLQKKKKRSRSVKKMKRRQELDEDGFVHSLSRLCLLSLADNMKAVWVKDYEENYLDRYHFTYIMGPIDSLPGGLVEELTALLCSRKQLSRGAALHLLVVPQLRGLSLAACPGLVTPRVCSIIAARCQIIYLISLLLSTCLDLSGAQQASPQAQGDMLRSMPSLRSLSLAGTPCDRGVIRTIARHCRALRHLDVSHCHLLSPADILPLGGGSSLDGAARCTDSLAGRDASTRHRGDSLSSAVTRCRHSSPSSSSCSSCCSSSSFCALPLRSLLATDIGLGEEEGEPAATAAYLLLSLPLLESVALEGLDWALGAIHRREFDPAEGLTRREGVPRLEEVWRERQKKHWTDRKGNEEAGAEGSREEREEESWEVHTGPRARTEMKVRLLAETRSRSSLRKKRWARGASGSRMLRGAMVVGPGDDSLTLRLREIQAMSPASLEVAFRLCPHIQSLAVAVDSAEGTGGRRDHGWTLAAGLGNWSGQLRSLTLRHTGPLGDLLTPLREMGFTLVSLTLEGVRTSPHCPLLEVLQACPRLKALVVSAQPPTSPPYEDEEEEEEEELGGARDLLRLPHLCSLMLSFDYEHQTKPAMSWRALQRVLLSLLWGSPLLERLSLTALPCHLNTVLRHIISSQTWSLHCHQHLQPGAVAASTPPSTPLGRVTHLGLARSDVTMATVMRLVEGCRTMKSVDLSCCWGVSHQDVLNSLLKCPRVTFDWL